MRQTMLEKPSTLYSDPTGEEVITPLGKQSHRLHMRDSGMIYISIETGKGMIYISTETGKRNDLHQYEDWRRNDLHQHCDWKRK